MIYYDDDRYHATYLRNDTVFYRRSNMMGDTAGSIIWEALERVVSADPFSIRVRNWAPSMTMRTLDGDVIASIVWSCHSDSTGVRDVVLRDMKTASQVSSLIHFVDHHTGTDSTQWGDAVISAAHGGDFIAWGDSTLGILARVRRLATFGNPLILSSRDSVSRPYHTTRVGRWPTVPTFAHIRGADSNCGIAWNQRTAPGITSHIRYARLLQLPATGGIPGILRLNNQLMSAAPSLLGRPTIDQTQDVWHRVQEGLAWQEENGGYSVGQEKIWFRSIYTPTNDASPQNDSIEQTEGWGFATNAFGPKDTPPDCFPNTSALNEVYNPIDDSLKDAHFSITFVSYEGTTPAISQAVVQYGTTSFRNTYPSPYAHGGDMPHGSSAPITQDYRHAVLYETTLPVVGPVLRTTRQYFGARAKPSGYIAEGRSVHFPIDDSAGTYIEVLMHDAWVATNTSAAPLDMTGRDFTVQTDSLAQVGALLRTACFAAGDSTRVGLELAGRFRGDSGIGGAVRVSLIAELVDSASGMVVAQLDSITIGVAADSQRVLHAVDYDLLSGTYYIRVRIDTASLTLENRSHGPRYPVAEYAGKVAESPAARAVHYLGPTTGTGARISAQPNPLDDRTEIRFSIRSDDRVTIVIVDATGREVARPVRDEYFVAGRYAVELSTGNFTEGTYVMELRAGSMRAIEKLIVRR